MEFPQTWGFEAWGWPCMDEKHVTQTLISNPFSLGRNLYIIVHE